MDSRYEKLLETFEEFEVDLEVEELLAKVKRELLLNDESIREFAESLKQLEPEKVEAQRRRAEQAVPFHQRCYPPIDLRLVRRGSRLLLFLLEVPV